MINKIIKNQCDSCRELFQNDLWMCVHVYDLDTLETGKIENKRRNDNKAEKMRIELY